MLKYLKYHSDENLSGGMNPWDYFLLIETSLFCRGFQGLISEKV